MLLPDCKNPLTDPNHLLRNYKDLYDAIKARGRNTYYAGTKKIFTWTVKDKLSEIVEEESLKKIVSRFVESINAFIKESSHFLTNAKSGRMTIQHLTRTDLIRYSQVQLQPCIYFPSIALDIPKETPLIHINNGKTKLQDVHKWSFHMTFHETICGCVEYLGSSSNRNDAIHTKLCDDITLLIIFNLWDANNRKVHNSGTIILAI